MNNILWNDMLECKKHDIYLNKYISFHKAVKKIISIVTIVLTSTGIISFLEKWQYTEVVLILSFLSKSLELLQSHIIANDEYLNDIHEIRSKWIEKYFKLEIIFLDFSFGNISEIESLERYKLLKPLEKEISDKMGNIKIWEFWYMNRVSNKYSNLLMKKYHVG